MLLNNLNQPVNVAPTCAVTMPRESRIPPQSLYSHRFVRCGDMFRLGTRAKLKQ